MDFNEKFEKFIQRKKLFDRKSKVLLAVSGGVDSVVMSDLFQQCGFSFGIAHCNFQLRGKESVKDEEFVEALAEKYHAPFHSIRFETKKFASESKLSVQEAARILRYNWFEEIRKDYQYTLVATAHHFNDSMETFFINLLRGTGIAGLAGIKPKSENFIVRPMLFARRKEVEEFAKKQKLKLRHDKSNDKDDYLRNRIRHHLIPVLLKLNPDFEKVMERNLSNLEFASTVFSGVMEKKRLQHFHNTSPVEINFSGLTGEEYPVEILAELIRPYGFGFSKAETIFKTDKPGKVFHASKHSIFIDRGNMILKEKEKQDDDHFILEEGRRAFSHPHFNLKLKSLKRKSAIAIPADKSTHMLDQQKLVFPLTIRRWKAGDRFFPLGMSHSRKVSDFLIDRKVSMPDKAKTYVLLSGKQIVCILGERIDNRCRIADKTKEIFWIQYQIK